MIRNLSGLAIFILFIFLSVISCTAKVPDGIALNEDDSHFFSTRSSEQMTIEGLNALVDQYAGTQVTQIFFCPNAQKAGFRSSVWESIWDLKGTQKSPGEKDRFASNARLLYERNIDPYAVWIARCREKGISPWLTMRMNDVHYADDPDHFIHSSFWRDHPEYWRVPNSKGSTWTDRALDYAIPEVRAHAFSFIRELLERYDPDGIELDWMRFGYHFKPGHEAEGCVILTQFMRDVRALTMEWSQKRGHPIKLGARVPALPDAALGLGMDGVEWASEGLVDMLVPTAFWATSDFDSPIEDWRARIGEAQKNVTIAAGQELLLRAYPPGPSVKNDLASLRGFAAAALQRGADQIYLFNYMDPEPMQGPPGTYRVLLEQGLSLDTDLHNPRRYPVTYHDTVPKGMSRNVVLPVDGFKGGTFQIYIGKAPKEGSARFVVGLKKLKGCTNACFETFTNGVSCSAMPDQTDLASLPGVERALVFNVPLEALHDGYNSFKTMQTSGLLEQQVVWAELQLQSASVPRLWGRPGK